MHMISTNNECFVALLHCYRVRVVYGKERNPHRLHCNILWCQLNYKYKSLVEFISQLVAVN